MKSLKESRSNIARPGLERSVWILKLWGIMTEVLDIVTVSKEEVNNFNRKSNVGGM